MSEKVEGKRGILITAPDGTLYNIPEKELSRFVVSPDKAESTILDAEAAGFVELDQPAEADQSPASALAPPGNPVVINIFLGQGPAAAGADTAEQVGGPTSMAKYAGGTTMAKYAGGTSMAKYAGGTTMGQPSARPSTGAAAVFYGGWSQKKEEKQV